MWRSYVNVKNDGAISLKQTVNRLSKEDLAQINQEYFQSLDKQKLVEFAGNLHKLAVEQLGNLTLSVIYVTQDEYSTTKNSHC